MKRRILLVFLTVIALNFMVGCAGFENPMTPAGYEGYLFENPYFFGEKKFAGTQKGQTSPGLSWRLFVVNIDMRTQTFSEGFEVLAKDDLVITFKAHMKMHLEDGSVKEIVERYGAQNWYARNIREPYRAAVYDAVSRYKALETKDRRSDLAIELESKMKEMTKGTPFVVEIVVIGNINPPPAVAQAVEEKLKADQELQLKEKKIEIAKREAQIRVEEANGIAKAQRIINETLSDRYLQYIAIQAQERMAASPNHTTVYVPSGTNGIPLIKTID